MAAVFELYSIGDAAYLTQVLQSVAMVAGTDDLRTLAGVGFLFGFILISFQGMMQAKLPAFHHMLMAWVIYMGAFGPVATVKVEDVYTGSVRTVDNVPFGVAFVGAAMSQVGYGITSLFETGFSTPSMADKGFAAPLYTLQNVRKGTYNALAQGAAIDPAGNGSDMSLSWSQFFNRCVLVNVDLGNLNAHELMRTPDWTVAFDPGSLNSWTSQLRLSSTPETKECPQSWADLKAFTLTYYEPAIRKSLATVINVDPTNVTATVRNALDALGQVSVDAQNYMTMAALLPHWERGLALRKIDIGQYEAAVAIEQAAQQRNTQWAAEATLFNQVVRPMMTFFEAFLFAVSPLMAFAIALGPMGVKMVGKWLMFALWIQLWQPVLAIIHLYTVMVTTGQLDALQASSLGDVPLTSMMGLLKIDLILQHWIGVAGMLAASTPAISLLLIYGSAITATHLAGRLQGGDHINEKMVSPDVQQPAAALSMGSLKTHSMLGGTTTPDIEKVLPTMTFRTEGSSELASTSQYQQQAITAFNAALSNAAMRSGGSGRRAGDGAEFRDGHAHSRSRLDEAVYNKAKTIADRYGLDDAYANQLATVIGAGLTAEAGGNIGAGLTDFVQKTIEKNVGKSDGTTITDTEGTVKQDGTGKVDNRMQHSGPASGRPATADDPWGSGAGGSGRGGSGRGGGPSRIQGDTSTSSNTSVESHSEEKRRSESETNSTRDGDGRTSKTGYSLDAGVEADLGARVSTHALDTNTLTQALTRDATNAIQSLLGDKVELAEKMAYDTKHDYANDFTYRLEDRDEKRLEESSRDVVTATEAYERAEKLSESQGFSLSVPGHILAKQITSSPDVMQKLERGFTERFGYLQGDLQRVASVYSDKLAHNEARALAMMSLLMGYDEKKIGAPMTPQERLDASDFAHRIRADAMGGGAMAVASPYRNSHLEDSAPRYGGATDAVSGRLSDPSPATAGLQDGAQRAYDSTRGYVDGFASAHLQVENAQARLSQLDTAWENETRLADKARAQFGGAIISAGEIANSMTRNVHDQTHGLMHKIGQFASRAGTGASEAASRFMSAIGDGKSPVEAAKQAGEGWSDARQTMLDAHLAQVRGHGDGKLTDAQMAVYQAAAEKALPLPSFLEKAWETEFHEAKERLRAEMSDNPEVAENMIRLLEQAATSQTNGELSLIRAYNGAEPNREAYEERRQEIEADKARWEELRDNGGARLGTVEGGSGSLSFRNAGQDQLDADFRGALVQASARLGQPLTILSGYRSPEHNARVRGAAKRSFHTKGIAADISMEGMNAQERRQLVDALVASGVNRFGTYDNHPDMLHVDNGWGDQRHFMHNKTVHEIHKAPAWFKDARATHLA